MLTTLKEVASDFEKNCRPCWQRPIDKRTSEPNPSLVLLTMQLVPALNACINGLDDAMSAVGHPDSDIELASAAVIAAYRRLQLGLARTREVATNAYEFHPTSFTYEVLSNAIDLQIASENLLDDIIVHNQELTTHDEDHRIAVAA